MLALTSAQSDALRGRAVMRRNFIWVEARNPTSGGPDPVGFWNDVGTVEHSGRIYHGSGNVISISTMNLKGDLTIPGLTISLSGIAPEVAALVRGEVIAQAPVEVLLGIFDVAAKAVIAPLIKRFDGFVDDVTIRTPEAGGPSTIELICESSARALTIKRTGTRSQSTQHERNPQDDFYMHTGEQREKPLYFGRKAPTDAARDN
jgi:hypothetical protein